LHGVEDVGKGTVHDRYGGECASGKITNGALATTINSLWMAGYNPARTLLLFDEFRSTLSMLAGELIKNDDVFTTLETFMDRCPYKIFADADWDIDQACPSFMRRFAKHGRPYALMRYTIVKDPRIVSVTSNEALWKELLIRRLKGGERVLVGCCSKKVADGLFKMARDELGVTARIYTGACEYNAHKADFLPENGGVDAAWCKYQLVIMNGAVTVAVDPQVTRFDHVMLHHCRMSMHMSDAFQLAQRAGRLGDTAPPPRPTPQHQPPPPPTPSPTSPAPSPAPAAPELRSTTTPPASALYNARAHPQPPPTTANRAG